MDFFGLMVLRGDSVINLVTQNGQVSRRRENSLLCGIFNMTSKIDNVNLVSVENILNFFISKEGKI